MKAFNIKFISAFLLIVLSSTSCNFLELESQNDLDADTYFTETQNAEDALIGIYSSMQSSSYYGGYYLLVSEPLCNNSVTGGFDNINIDEFGFQAVTPSNIIVEEMWYSIYNVIANANRLIEGIEKINSPEWEEDDTRKNEIIGQARALRALAHFDLLRFFGEHWDNGSSYGVPIVDHVQEIGDVEPRATVADTYSFIISELEASLDLVNQDERDQAFVNVTTIQALLARVYLYKGEPADLVKAIEYATEVIDDGTYYLIESDKYATIFNDRETPESIFELAFDSQNRSRYNGLTYSRPEALNTEVNFLSAKDLSDFFNKAERDGDVRASLVDSVNNEASILPNGRTQKYRGEVNEDNPAYILRLAEMYLIRAEALGFDNNGIADINVIRNQRNLGDASPASADEFQQILLDEIRAEFNFEGHYFFDLARLELIESELGLEPHRAILPIPLREITTTNNVVEQNPEY